MTRAYSNAINRKRREAFEGHEAVVRKARGALIACALLAIAVSLPAQSPAKITVAPAASRGGETVTVTITGTWSDSCTPNAANATLDGRIIRIQAATPQCTACTAILTPYSITTQFVVPTETAAAGRYDIEYYVVDCASRRTLNATSQVYLGGVGKCNFGEALVVDEPFARPGESPMLSWCDPSLFLSNGGVLVLYYRVFQSSSLDGPFTELADLAPPTTTLPLTAAAAGMTYYYVAARMCQSQFGPPPVPCDRPADVLTNIVAVAAPVTATCAPSPTALCLANRFHVTARWQTLDQNGDGRATALTAESGYFWFFSPTNVEVTVKVLDACRASQPSFWVFASGMTNVGVHLSVTDTKTGITRQYVSGLGIPFVTILDTNAFSCP